MARLEQSIEVNVAAPTVYNQLTQFEDYPRFMEDIEEVRQLDDTHLHWRAKLNSHATEWDAEIVEQVPDQVIVWRNMGGPIKVEKVEVRPLDGNKSKVTMSMEYEEQQQQAQKEDMEIKVAEHAVHDLLRFKRFIESRRQETGAWRGEVHGGREVSEGGGAAGQQPSGQAAAAPSSQGAQGQGAEQAVPSGRQQGASTQPAASMSQGEGAQTQVSAEQSFDQQSQQARQVGQMPEQAAQAMQQGAGAGQQQASPQAGQQAAQPAGQQAQPERQQAAGQQAGAQAASAQPSGAQQAGAQMGPSQGQGAGQQPGGGQSLQAAAELDPTLAAAMAMNPQTWLPNLLHAWEEPFVMMRKMTEDMDQIFERFIGRPMYGARPRQLGTPSAATWVPPLEVAQRDNQLVIRAEVPGVKQDDVHIEIKNDRLIIEGDRREEAQQAGQGFRRTERSYGHFYRVVALPEGVNPEAASAAMRDGVLEITVPMQQQMRQQGRQLDIR